MRNCVYTLFKVAKIISGKVQADQLQTVIKQTQFTYDNYVI